jgi:hypothetical protein
MIEWLRALSPPLRFLMYLAGALLVLFMSVGIGASAAVVVDWQSGRVATDSAESSTITGSESETTSTARASEDTAIETPSDSQYSNDTAYEASFIHRATDENSRGDYTYISDPSMNGDPDAVVLISNQRNVGSTTYDHNIGVWYEAGAEKWAIFNQDRAAVPAGATFRVEVPQPSATFVHHANLLNTVGNYTYLDNQLTNGEPEAVLSVTQNWNPGGGRGVYNDHPVGTVYDADVKRWAVYNRDGASMPKGAAFNIAVSAGTNNRARQH